jgi:preprotein translocase subunit SecA
MEPLYRCCWVSVGSVTSEMAAEERREGYRRDVTYTTNKELVADFLRDRLWLGGLQNAGRRQIACLLGRKEQIEEGMVTRGIHSAIVDEADSILIDEAVTPLIISRSQPDAVFSEACLLAHELARGLRRERDYSVNEKLQEIRLQPGLERRLQEKVRASSARYRGLSGYLELIRQALSAREFFQRDRQYVLHEGRVVIVDEFTGRQMPQRTWQAGLHQFIEAKEGLELTPPSETLARLSFQRFYRFFHRLAGMTGTAREALQEFWDIYRLPTVKIPENRPCRRQVLPLRAFPTAEAKWRALVAEIRSVHASGRPLLVGTRNVRASENLSRRLERLRLGHRVLNAVRHQEEALIVAGAGQRGAVTIATNMAGRGTDIRLGPGVEELGGLHVIASECHESRRIDRQLFGRSARQGDAGSARLFVSLEDEIPVRHLPEALRRLLRLELERRFPAAELQAAAGIRLAQHSAQQQAYRRRRAVLQMDNWLEDSLSFGRREIN